MTQDDLVDLPLLRTTTWAGGMGGLRPTPGRFTHLFPLMRNWKPVSSIPSPRRAPRSALSRLLADPSRQERITHVETVPARQGHRAEWPSWVPGQLIERLGT